MSGSRDAEKRDFAREAREAFLTSWVHGGLLSCAETVARLADPGSRGRDKSGAWKDLADELVSGMRREELRNPDGYRRIVAKPLQIAPAAKAPNGRGKLLTEEKKASPVPKGFSPDEKEASPVLKGTSPEEKRASTDCKELFTVKTKASPVPKETPPVPKGTQPKVEAARRRKKPWESWSLSSSEDDGDDVDNGDHAEDAKDARADDGAESADEDGNAVAETGEAAEDRSAVELYRSLLAKGRYPDALLAGCRLAQRSARGREAAWAWAVQASRLAAEDAEDDGEDPGKAWERVRFAEAVARVDMAGSRRATAATAAAAAGFESALAAVLAVCSGDLAVRRGWRSSIDAARALSDAYEAALDAVPRRADPVWAGEATGSRGPRRGNRSPRTKTLVIPESGRAGGPCVRVSAFRESP